MNQDMIMNRGLTYPLGVTVVDDVVNIAVPLYCIEECGLVLYHKSSGEEHRLVFLDEWKIGNLYCVKIEKFSYFEYYYSFFEDKCVKLDVFGKKIHGNVPYGTMRSELELKCEFVAFDKPVEPLMPTIPYQNCIMYCIHVRGFTKHISSKVKNRGTFLGIVEKIPYLKELGITTLELLPIYEFLELEEERKGHSMDLAVQRYKEMYTGDQDKRGKLNYWGFKKGYYFAPKSSYGATDDVITEVKDMISKLHENGIEVILQFYFPETIKPGYMLAVLKYWVLEYGVDGFHIKGERIPLTLLGTEPLLAHTKLLYFNFPLDEIYEYPQIPDWKNLASFNEGFLTDARRFLKGDEDMLPAMIYHLKDNPQKEARINFITNYEGFTLYDLVSYERKQNEENGEENRDGKEYNYSWNCGTEGQTKKKNILLLRKQQMKNALCLVLLSQGTPFLLGGDELCNTQKGNNNPYCQDNETSWINWNQSDMNQEIFSFCKQLIELRKKYKILHRAKECTLMDTLGCTYPDLSFHSNEAWKVKMENYYRHVGMMYCGKYEQEDTDIYIAFNMYWDEEHFALPKLPKGKNWYVIMNTDEKESFLLDPVVVKNLEIVAKRRSVLILISK